MRAGIYLSSKYKFSNILRVALLTKRQTKNTGNERKHDERRRIIILDTILNEKNLLFGFFSTVYIPC